MRCNNCGTEVKEGLRFCPNCGSEMPVQPVKQKNDNTGLIVGLSIGGVFLFLSIIFAVIFIFFIFFLSIYLGDVDTHEPIEPYEYHYDYDYDFDDGYDDNYDYDDFFDFDNEEDEKDYIIDFNNYEIDIPSDYKYDYQTINNANHLVLQNKSTLGLIDIYFIDKTYDLNEVYSSKDKLTERLKESGYKLDKISFEDENNEKMISFDYSKNNDKYYSVLKTVNNKTVVVTYVLNHFDNNTKVKNTVKDIIYSVRKEDHAVTNEKEESKIVLNTNKLKNVINFSDII